jgi:hypothetical protein
MVSTGQRQANIPEMEQHAEDDAVGDGGRA